MAADNQSKDVTVIIIADSNNCSNAELAQICKSVQRNGFAVYEWQLIPKDPLAACIKFNQQLGLKDSEADQGVASSKGLSTLRNLEGESLGRFIPYTNRAMNWHTDGYYNSQDAAIRCFTLHSVAAASEGGTLKLVDSELLLIGLYDQDPHLVQLLSHPRAMMLPANKDTDGHDRPDRYVPVISMHADGTLDLRFTARTKNIHWRNTATQQAAEHALTLLERRTDWQHSLRLKTGQGVITRNVLHKREAFNDSPKSPQREMLRGRYTRMPEPFTNTE